MNKNEFLNELRKRLKLLDNGEIDDIISEYSVTIDEKIKNGKTEIEAVKDFGDIDELAKEILSAYKINPDYKEKNSNSDIDNIINRINEIIKDLSRKVVDIGNKFLNKMKIESNNDKDTTTIILELLFKVIIVLFIITILRLPFVIISSIGSALLGVGNFSFSKFTVLTFSILMEFIYIIACIYFGSLIINKFIFTSPKRNTPTGEPSDNNKDTVFKYKEDVNDKSNEVNNMIVAEEKKDKKNKDIVTIRESNYSNLKNNSGCSSIIMILLKLFVILVFIVPLITLIVISSIFLIFFFLLTISGIPVIGACIALIGGIILTASLINIFISIISEKTNLKITPIIVSIVLILVGITVSVNNIFKIEYISDPYKDNINLKSSEYIFEVNDETDINVGSSDYTKKIDNTITDNKVYITVLYSDIFFKSEESRLRNTP